jgi:hypothetical protein
MGERLWREPGRIKYALTIFIEVTTLSWSSVLVPALTASIALLFCIMKKDVSESERQKDSGERKNQEYLHI